MLPSNAKVVSLLHLLLYLTQGVAYLGTRLKALKILPILSPSIP